MAVIVGSTNLSTLNLRLSKIEGDLDLPAYKKIIEVNSLPERLRKKEENEVTVTLIGVYATKNDLIAKVNAFRDLFKAKVALRWQIDVHGIDSFFVAKAGASIGIYGKGAEIKIVLTETTQPL